MASNGLFDDSPECPLCMEPLSLDDINFYPCACRYQVCRFCWHRIRTDENGLCPHCREPYSENPAEYTPLSQEQLAKVKTERRQKTQEKRQKVVESRKNLASIRVVQRNLVFVIGLSPRLADPEMLKRNEYFGKYGRIYKVVINNSNVYNGAQGPSVSAYVTYYRNEDASRAIQAVNNAYIDGRYLKASFGTTKYCTYFLRGTQCTKPDCMYLHELGENDASFTKEDMQMGKHQQYESSHLSSSGPAPPPPVKEQAKSKPQQPTRAKEVTVTEDHGNTALPATASWASAPASKSQSQELKPEHFQSHSHSSKGSSKSHSTGSSNVAGSHSHSTSRSSKQKSHSRNVTSSAKHGLKTDSSHKGEADRSRGGSSNRSGPTSPSSSTGSSGGMESGLVQLRKQPPVRSDSRGSRGSSSSKPATPNLSPKSSLSASSSTGSLKMDGDAKLSQEKVATVAASEKDSPLVRPSGTGERLLPATNQSRLEEDEVARDQTDWKAQEEEPNAVKVIEALGSAGTGQFGSLGVSWNTDQAPVLSTPPPNPQEDDLGFDPWHESKRGLADLLETEGQGGGGRRPVPSTREPQEKRPMEEVGRGQGVGQNVVSDSSSWQDEFRALFPTVNISFGGARQASQSTQDVSSPSLRDAVENSTPISSLQVPPLSSSFGYSFPLTNHSAAFGSHGSRGEAGGWPDFSTSNGSTSSKESASDTKPPPPPGFAAKSKNVPASAIRAHSLISNTRKVPGQQAPPNLPAQVVYVPRWGGYVNIQQAAAANPALIQQLLIQQRQQYLAARARQQSLLLQGQVVQPQLEPTTIAAGNGHTTSVSTGGVHVSAANSVLSGQTGTGLVQSAALGSAMGLPHVMACQTAGQVVAIAPGSALSLQPQGAVYGLVHIGQAGQEGLAASMSSINRTQQDGQRLNVKN